jgi:hypothetical protein
MRRATLYYFLHTLSLLIIAELVNRDIRLYIVVNDSLGTRYKHIHMALLPTNLVEKLPLLALLCTSGHRVRSMSSIFLFALQ